MSDSIIQIKDVNKWYGDFQVLKDINLEVKAKEKIVVCGPSGSGKSTLIRCINRLEEHQEGNIVVDGTEISEDTKNIEQVRAEVGMVFQQFNLFPHLSIIDNCTLAPIWVKKMPKKDAEELALTYSSWEGLSQWGYNARRILSSKRLASHGEIVHGLLDFSISLMHSSPIL